MNTPIDWRQSSQVFDQKADEYDSWFENSLLFDIELAALKEIKTPLGSPRLEIGVGPGRFAREVDVAFGVDPAIAPLYLSQKRGIGVIQASGEELPLANSSVGTAFLLFALCFLNDPVQAIDECSRVVKKGGHLVLGMIPSSGAWGQSLEKKKNEGHPFYEYARFYDMTVVGAWLKAAGFQVVEVRSSLFQQPGKLKVFEHSRSGLSSDAGFWVIVAKKSE
ncbi:MAG: class I SAM-dependent methyltransferase [Desulfobulbaceae bacterium]|uniref:Class I SAM-dependent methyltransferase n=1 Tax=Candidatus Desulfobia pelagia TaxID=2841692 RepID=A0A8J6NA95_9BACT|nr:class I SAM-dependent methyltransferase [Candidatus Desulfobia pelagia]